MDFKKLLQLLLSSGLLSAEPAYSPLQPHVSADEILSYACARSVAGLVTDSQQMGPLFAVGDLVFTSVEAQDMSRVLLVNAGYGNYAIPLFSAGINRIRFEIPTSKKGPSHQFFLSYMHGGQLRSRYFEFSEGEPPIAKDEWGYLPVQARRADYLQPHLNYAIAVTAEATLGALSEGRLNRNQLLPHRMENCEHIVRSSPTLGRNLSHNLDQLDMLVMGPATTSSSRSPASVATPKPSHPFYEHK